MLVCIKKHEGFNETTRQNDIAIIILNKEMLEKQIISAFKSINLLEYESAFEICKNLIKVKTDTSINSVIKDSIDILRQELAYYYFHTNKNSKLKDLNCNASENDIKKINPVNYDVIRHKYFPQMIDIDNKIKAGKSEVSKFQYNLFLINEKKNCSVLNDLISGADPVTGISFYDAIHYCNWLSKYLGADSAYIEKANFKFLTDLGKQILGSGEISKAYSNLTKDFLITISLNNSTKGYRLPNVEEWKAANKKFNVSKHPLC